MGSSARGVSESALFPPEPVTVIGAGLAGCLTALHLAWRRVPVRLIAPTLGDSAPFPSPLNRSPVSAAQNQEGDPLRTAVGRTGHQAGQWMATALSYGSVAGLAAAARWQELERRHGSLGWRRSAVVLHGCIPPCAEAAPVAEPGALGESWWSSGAPRRSTAMPMRMPMAEVPGWIRWITAQRPLLPAPLPFSRLDGPALARALPGALQRAGVELICGSVLALESAASGWHLQLADGRALHSPKLLLAAGAGSVALWPPLRERLRSSWAGVLLLPDLQGHSRWLAAVRRGWMVFPARLQRPALERLAPASDPRWILDLGLAPWGPGALLGQITWLPPASEAAAGGTAAHSSPEAAFRPGAPAPPADPAQLERVLRQGLAQLDPALADLEADFHLAPVSYCPDGVPVAEALAPGLWVLAGCSNAYSHLPALAEALAEAILAAGSP